MPAVILGLVMMEDVQDMDSFKFRALEIVNDVLQNDILEFLMKKPRWFVADETWDIFPFQDSLCLGMNGMKRLSWFDSEDGTKLCSFAKKIKSLSFSKDEPWNSKNVVSLKQSQASGMSKKKKHEVEQFSCLINEFSGSGEKNDIVVDIGSGEGYLPCILSCLYGRNVIGIEGSDKITRQSLQRRIKMLGGDQGKVPIFKDVLIEKGCHEHFRKTLQYDGNVLLCGLHCCGELSNNVIELFIKDEKVRKLALVGCCYGRFGLGYRMTFPLSNFLKQEMSEKKQSLFNTIVFRCACDHIIFWKMKTEEEFEELIREMIYRCLSEDILIKQCGKDNFECNAKIQKKHCKDFPTYFKRVLETVKIREGVEIGDILQTNEDELRKSFDEMYYGEGKKKIALMLSVRTSFSLAVESLIILGIAKIWRKINF